MRLSQGDLADLLDVSRAAVSQATEEGHKCGGYPVRAWAVFDGAGRVSGYEVPKRVLQRSNPAPSYVQMEDDEQMMPRQETQNGWEMTPSLDFLDVLGADPGQMDGTTWPEAVDQNTTPVAGTAGGTIATAKFLEVLDNHPATLSSYMLDLGFPLIAAVLAVYATTEETDYRLLKIGLFALSGWATIRVVRAIVQRWEAEQEASVTQEPLSRAQGDAVSDSLDMQ